MEEIRHLLSIQDGVIARRQALAAGCPPTTIRRLLRRREWVTVHPGVYVDHTGPLTWRQRAWAAVLFHWPAALDGRSALRAHEGPGRRQHDDRGPIEVVVAHARRPVAVEGIRVRRSRRFDEAVQLDLHPPRQRYDDAVIELADRSPDELRAIAVLADACGSRRTTALRLQQQLAAMGRVTRRSWLTAVLADVAEGTCSVLEHGYLTRVERAHGLPRGLRQVAARDGAGRRMYRDVLYVGRRPPWRQIVELDGRLDHDSSAARDRDLERDLDAALELTDTVRLGYGQVFARSCSTAAKLGILFQQRGWQGAPTTCPRCQS
ncbi:MULTISPECIES: type IV toxin-antitoxin system AbiEi family antitoxin domain-containing protein [unclassified Nocardioides]|uniref:type IV toxin-antitoxin system AbiEi family antitoxin domain-containing protein n=1 Tax=unclassified Nocardioides TaxID=2615069 RepID=UPI0006F269AA|nr:MULTISPECIES: type IV toxin-antitoxin system AbiEi family antitoxin domain-containing protein [unclassified Nocardioides]KRA38976.1 hypothetical protein ASD81_10460 [Nocardioides sp. Root614]KRA92935.1 hypothetical protein ASD84_10725 [Nocardioides sp. Root682]